MTTTAQRMEESGVPWWLILIEGIALIILGILFLTNPASTTVIFIQVLGIYWLIKGILAIVAIFIDSTRWGWKLLIGILGIVAGLIILQHPLWSPIVVGSALIIILGIEGLIMGVVEIIQAFQGAGWGSAILGILSIIIGIWLLANIGAATLALPWAVGLLAIIGGIIAIVAAFRAR